MSELPDMCLYKAFICDAFFFLYAAAPHGVQPKLMAEMLSLAQQLQGIIRMYYPPLASALGIPPPGKKQPSIAASLGLKAPPTPVQESLLRQVSPTLFTVPCLESLLNMRIAVCVVRGSGDVCC